MSVSAASFSFPHPVLWHRDDIGGASPAVEIGCIVTEQLVSVTLGGLVTGNAKIDALVKSGNAAWTARFACQRTYVRREVVIAGTDTVVHFRASDLWGRVEIDLAVIALERTTNYQPTALHEDYGAATTFVVEPGSILAQAPQHCFAVDKEFDALRSPAASLMRIGEGSAQSGPMTVAYRDWIHVQLSKDDWAHWSRLTDRQSFIHAAIALPILVGAIQIVQVGQLGDSEALRRLQDKVAATPELTGESDPLIIAQRLLGLPLQRAINEHIAESLRGEYD